MAHDVFISYSSEDKTIGDGVCAVLEANGIRCWIAPRDVFAGSDYGETIIDAINTSQCMVLIFSKHANCSNQVLREVERAVSKGVPVMPVRIEDIALSKAMEYRISSVHWLDAFTPPLENHLKRLAIEVQTLLRSRAEGRGEKSPASPSLRSTDQLPHSGAVPFMSGEAGPVAYAVGGVGSAGESSESTKFGAENSPHPSPGLIGNGIELSSTIAALCEGNAEAEDKLPLAQPIPQPLQRAMPEDAWIKIVSRKMVSIRRGVFIMGSNEHGASERPSHEVSVSPFFMQKCLVTQRDYAKIMGSNPSNFVGNPNRPAESVSWTDAVKFCNAWSRADGLDPIYEILEDEVLTHFEKNGYRLPTEAEWEYACRAGSTSEFFWGDTEVEADLYAWHDGNSEDSTQAVGTKRPNPFGLYDMVGNLWEWTNDWFSMEYYGLGERDDPKGPEFGEAKVLRGGSWFNGKAKLRSPCRLKRLPGLVDDVTGFRCVARYTPTGEASTPRAQL